MDEASLSITLRRIAAQASTARERLNAPHLLALLPEAAVAPWVAAVGPEHWPRFLAWEGLTEAEVRRAVAPVQWRAEASLPAWAEAVGAALRRAELALESLPPGCDPSAPLPFEALLAPFAADFQTRLAVEAADVLAPPAQHALTRGLLRELAHLAAPALLTEFRRFSATGLSPLARFVTAEPDALYRQFVARLTGGAWLDFLTRYPVLARWMGTRIVLWTAAHIELAQRLAADLPGLRERWGSAPPVMALEPALSDPHDGGRQVSVLTFAAGPRLVYKPRPVMLAAAFQQLLEWLTARAAPVDLRAPEVWAREGYGWLTFLTPQPCTDAALYYRRAGALLAVLHLLDATDAHAENLLACGDYPVLMDAETLLHPRVRRLPATLPDAEAEALARLEHSVLRTGMLPGWSPAEGVGGAAVAPARGWLHINTDRMAQVTVAAPVPPTSHIPQTADGPAPAVYLPEIVAGFEALTRFCLVHREALLSGPLPAFRGCETRFVFRSTRVYGQLLARMAEPPALRDGLVVGWPLEMLARAFLRAPERSAGWPLLAAERQALLQGDIPRFSVGVEAGALPVAPGVTIPDYFEAPSYAALTSRLRALGEAAIAEAAIAEAAIAEQAQWIREAALLSTGAEPGEQRTELSQAPDCHSPFAICHFLEEALALAAELRRRAVVGDDGSVTWIAPQPLHGGARPQFAPLGYDLYDGLAGVALFWAALYRVRGEAEAREMALGALAPVCALARGPAGPWLAARGLGGAEGAGSLLYALAQIGAWLAAPALWDVAREVAGWLPPERIAAEKRVGVVDGLAGAALGLLALHQVAPEEGLAIQAGVCGRRLLALADAEAAQTGFAHGAAGVALALLRLHTFTGEIEFRRGAEALIAAETAHFSAEAGNWRDLRPDPEAAPRFAGAWCNGAPGIGLARVGGLDVLDTPGVRRDIDAALTTTRRLLAEEQHRQADHVCCGNFGRIDILLEAGQRLVRPEWRALAQTTAAQVVARAHRFGGYHLSGAVPRGVFAPGFFQGMAGIGYSLLRLAYPGQLPAVLLWEVGE